MQYPHSHKKKFTELLNPIQYFKNVKPLFGRLYIVNHLQEGQSDIFFSHTKTSYIFLRYQIITIENWEKNPTWLSAWNLIFYWIYCIWLQDIGWNDTFSFIKSTINKPIYWLYRKCFICHIKRELECCYRIDIVWDQYFSHSIKESTTKKARSGVKKRLIKIKMTSWLAKFSNNWLNFRTIG